MKKFCFFLTISFSLILISCKKTGKIDEGEEARELFKESSSLLIKVIDQIKLANDSLTIDSLQNFFEKKLVEINFSFPPQTDLKLTEEENDSIFKLMQKLKIESSYKLVEFSSHISDSIPPEL